MTASTSLDPPTMEPAYTRPRRRRFRTRRTAAWTIAKLLLVSAFIGLGFAVYLAWQPVSNPGVQDCGSPIGFFLKNRQNVIIHPGEPGAPANAVALSAQPSCRDLSELELQKASVGLVAFFGLGLLGIVIGLVDDRVEYWRAPNFETLLKPMPREARERHGLVPKVQVEDLGARLPPLESPELWGIGIIGALTFVVLPFFGPLDATREALASPSLGPLLVGAALTAALFGAAALQRKAVYPDSDSWGRVIELVLASAFSGRLRPFVGSFGIDVHHLRRTGLRRDDAVLDVQVMQTVSVLLHVVLLALSVRLVNFQPFAPGELVDSIAERRISPQMVLAAGLIVFILSSLQRLGRRIRALPVRPAWAGLRGIWRVTGTVEHVVLLVGGTLAITFLNAFILVMCLAVFGATVPLMTAVFVTLAAVTVGAVVTSPDGLGGFEAAMALALMAAGIEPGVAIASTLAFRFLTFWLPMLAGWRASRSLHAAGAL